MRRWLTALLLVAACIPLSGEEADGTGWVTLRETVRAAYDAVPGEPRGRVVWLAPKKRLSTAAPKRILILFPKKSSAYDTSLEQIAMLFQAKGLDAEFTLFYYKKDAALGEEALRLAEEGGFSLIFSMGSDSTDFIHSRYRDGKIPVVTICSKDPVLRGQLQDYDSGSATNIAYTSLDMPVKIQLDYLQILKPGLKHVVVLYARQNKSAYETQVIPLVKSCAGTAVTVRELVVEEASRAKAELAEKVSAAYRKLAGADPGLQQSIFWITGSTEVFSEIATIVQYAGKIPVLSAVPDLVVSGGDSAVLSIGVGFESNAQLAAFYAVRILRGEAEPGKLPVGIVSPPDIAINFQKVRETGLKIPFLFFERASIIYDYQGRRARGKQP